VEDEESFHVAVEEGFEDAGVSLDLAWCRDGQEALDYLRNCQNPLPDLILLDLFMPVMDGVEFLSIWAQSLLAHRIKVVVMTTSPARVERERVSEYPISRYIQKPVRYEDLVSVLGDLGSALVCTCKQGLQNPKACGD